MTHRAPLVLLALLTGCAPTTQGPAAPPDPPSGPTEQILCATAAWDVGDTRPVSLELGLDLATGEAALRLDRAHEYGESDPFAFAPEAWTAEAEWSTADGLSIVMEGLSVQATRSEDLSGELWLGTLASGDHGSHDVVCWADTFVGDHTYDPTSGVCRDGDGAPGQDALPVAYVRASGDGHCGTFAGLSLNEDFLGYPILRGLDLRGAELDGATLFFAHIADARWEGADLTGFEFGYATLTGTLDTHTIWPSESCAVEDGALACTR